MHTSAVVIMLSIDPPLWTGLDRLVDGPCGSPLLGIPILMQSYHLQSSQSRES